MHTGKHFLYKFKQGILACGRDAVDPGSGGTRDAKSSPFGRGRNPRRLKNEGNNNKLPSDPTTHAKKQPVYYNEITLPNEKAHWHAVSGNGILARCRISHFDTAKVRIR